ncbi:hypothetical protein LTR20_009022 [Exophiala xenobiotica]|nr:hypothetical protein LTR41_005374 [Exophiala xenobiotica]KAK5261741.1 hypothetical protein LTR40_001692 [Exophiala xenobiotica]KAK5456605.1 hypothetical protein LTR20_009022 [Exophiala xenobiotica]
MVTTRSATSSPVKKSATRESNDESRHSREPLKHFILPKDTSDRARFVSLRHPRDSSAQRFLFCPERGLFHFTRINTPSPDQRSLLFENAAARDTNGGEPGPKERQPTFEDGYISKSAEMFVATPFDMAFLLIPFVIPAKAQTGKMLFQPLDDMFEQHIENDRHLRYILDNGRKVVEEAMSRFCDTIEAGDEQMYRPNEEKTLKMIMEKVKAVIEKGLPASLEEKFVTRALEAPVLSVKREETIISTKSESASFDDTDSVSENLDSQSSTASSAPSAVFSEVSVASSLSTVAPDTVSQALLDLRKQSIVLDFILASYVPEAIAERLQARFAGKDSPINFSPLEEHMKSLAVLRAEAMASRSIGDFSRKRGLEDDEAAELRAEKKLKQEEEERKKKIGESRGVRDLKKVNVAGMKKMSDFFSKKPVAKAKG